MKMERYLIDTNAKWVLQSEAGKKGNQNKAFIIGGTIADESENLKDLLFSKKMDISNNNIFGFGVDSLNGKPHLRIDRFDEHFRKFLDEEKLRQESRPRATRTDIEFLEMERKHMADVLDFKAKNSCDIKFI